MNITNKNISAALNSLILTHPFFAGILLQQNFREVSDKEVCQTMQVDGETFEYNPAFANSLSFDECKGVCAHEALHLALLHHTRAGNRDAETWNQACDYAINGELIESGFKLPAGGLIDPKFANMSAEDIYRQLEQEKKKDAQDGQGNKPSAPSMGGVKPAKGDAKAAEAKTKSMIEKAQSIARMAGDLPEDMARRIKDAMQPRFDWREILHRFFQDVCARDYSFANPNRRFIHSGLILPSLRSRSVGSIVLAIDTSGSISTEEVSTMVSEVQECMAQYTEEGINKTITVIYCDAKVQRVEVLSDGDRPAPVGGGGTDFRPVFEHIGNDLGNAACLVYLTDGECEAFPSEAPSYPVLWGLIRDNAAFAPPFGEVFKVNIV